MKSTLKILFAALALTYSAASFADTASHKGFYVGGDLGLGITSCDSCSFGADVDSSTSSSGGIAANLFLGYQFNAYFALETGVGFLPPVEYDLGDASDPAATNHYYFAIKGIYPINTQWGLFGKLGYDSMSVDSAYLGETRHGRLLTTDSFTANGVLLALGTSYTFKNSNLSMTGAYNQILDSASNNVESVDVSVGYVALGLSYLF